MNSLRDKLARACEFNENDTFFAKPQLGEKDCARYENERLQPYLQLLGECVEALEFYSGRRVTSVDGSWAQNVLARIASAVGER